MRWAVVQGVPLLLYCLWVPMLIGQIAKVRRRFWVPEPEALDLASTFMAHAGGAFLLVVFAFLVLAAILSVSGSGGGLEFRDLFRSLERETYTLRLRDPDMITILLVWMLTPMIVPYVYSLFSTPLYNVKFTIASCFPLYILAGRGLDNLSRTWARALPAGLIVAFSAANLYGYYTGVDKEQWREAAGYLTKRAERGELILVFPGYCLNNGYGHYSKRNDLVERAVPRLKGDYHRLDYRRLRPAIGKRSRFWLVRREYVGVEKIRSGRLKKLGFVVAEKKTFVGVEVYLLTRQPRKGGTGKLKDLR